MIRRSRRAFAVVMSVLVTAGLLTGISLAQSSEPAQALSGSAFQAGNIISDANFYNSNAMTEAQIQSFLQSQIGNCTNGLCLNVVRTDSTNQSADAMCGAYAGAPGELASTIIYKVQRACGISAKVILVTLQKEQGLVTNNGPSAARLARAMGYACPDSAGGACDSLFYGLFNQLYKAAWQFKRYGNPPGTSNFFNWFPVGGVSNVLWSPSACGSSPVVIQNKATAALYYYTPYQPNAAALTNLGGTGDACSSYGNRNFWVYYNNWFGSPADPPGTPVGAVTSMVGSDGGIAIRGWAIDPDVAAAPVTISIWVDGLWNYQWTANQSTPAATTPFAGAGPNHGWTGTVPAQPAGQHNVCVFAVNKGGPGIDVTLGCNTVTYTANNSPQGAVLGIAPAFNGLTLSGWAIDPDAQTQSTTISVWVDGQTNTQFTANTSSAAYPTAGAHFPSAGTNHGFSGRVPASPGDHVICIYGVDQGGGNDVLFSCFTVTVTATEPSPKGALLSAAGVQGGVALSGWAVDPDALTSPVKVSLWLDGKTNTQWTANQSYPAADAQYPGAGANHGWSGTLAASPGSHSVCVYAFNQNAGADAFFSCATVTVPKLINVSPQGAVLTASGVASGVSLTGWAVDPDALTSPVKVSLWLDGQTNTQWTANQNYPAADSQFPGAGANHGWSGTLAASPGKHTVCVYAFNQNAGADSFFECKTVTVPTSAGLSPQGAVLSASGVLGGVALSGWAVDPDALTSPVKVSLWLDGLTNTQWMANQSYPAADSLYPGAGASHGWSGTLAATAGQHTVCVYAFNQNAGADSFFSCSTITVPAAADPSPQGKVLSAAPTTGGIALAGWAVDPDALTSPVKVSLWLDGLTNTQWTANQSYPAADALFPGAGANHGWSGTLATTPGKHTVCVYAFNQNAGADSFFSCSTVTVAG